MSSMSNPNPWAPYDSYTDCSQGVCNIYCPQWCYLILPPPPPSFFNDEDDSSSSNSSLLLITLIGILVTAFILVSYYTLISKYCHRHRDNSDDGFFSSRQVNSNAATGDGLNDSLIKSIKVYKYRKGDGFVDCSVCLSEFEENESLRLLPKCNHAFHLPCIATWLKSHSNCPLCRAFVTATDSVHVNQIATASGNRGGGIGEISSNIDDYEHQSGESVVVIPDLEEQGERKDDGDLQTIRRSVSLNSGTVVVSIEDDGESSGVGTSQERREGDENGDGKTATLTAANQRSGGVSSYQVAMKRSVSTGRFIFSRYDRPRNYPLPN